MVNQSITSKTFVDGTSCFFGLAQIMKTLHQKSYTYKIIAWIWIGQIFFNGFFVALRYFGLKKEVINNASNNMNFNLGQDCAIEKVSISFYNPFFCIG